MLRSFWPAPVPVDARERARSVLGALLGIGLVALTSRWWLGAASPWLVAPLGASAVLVFAVPASPLAQPWSVVGGNTLSALVGLACARAIGDPALASGVAVAAAIAVMLGLRCLHPPGGAAALLAVLAQPLSWRWAIAPVLLDSVLLVLAAIVCNRALGRRYPHVVPAAGSATATPGSRFTAADLDAALAHYNQVLDVPRDDLEELLSAAEASAYQRNFGELRCADIMDRAPVTVVYGDTLQHAWRLIGERRLKSLPVIDRARRVVGIVTLADFVRYAGAHAPESLGERLRAFVRPSGTVASERPEVVGQVMTRRVRVVNQTRAIAELVPLFGAAGHRLVPVTDDAQRLVGVVTQADLLRALARAVRPDGEAATASVPTARGDGRR